MFSSRLPSALVSNAVTRAIEQLRAAGTSWLDLTETNPTVVGLPYPADVLRPLSDPRATVYRPEPFGLETARAAVADEYARRGTPVAVDRVALTASTSEAYATLFKLLCNPGDDVLVPQPSYPLFDLLTRLDDVAARPYRLHYDGAWWIDRRSVEAAVTPRTRAVLIVSPNNPTGSMLRLSDREWLLGFCRARELAIIADEVFIDYPLARRADASCVLGQPDVLTFSLGGLSKSAGLPQVKLGWMVVDGPEPLVRAAQERLEIIHDTYLSVSTPVQYAAPHLMESGRSIRAAIHQRVRVNLEHITSQLDSSSPVTLLAPEAGWSAVLRVPALESEEALVLRVLREACVLVHPGYFFDFDAEAFLVVSLLPEPVVFATALERVLDAVETERV